MSEGLDAVPKPEGYRAPGFDQVQALAVKLREERQPKLDKIAAAKRAVRGDWEDVLRRIPRAWRKVQPEVDLPEVRDMLRRVVGRIAKNEPSFEVLPPSGRIDDVRRAAKEEARIPALKQAIEDQQDESIYGLGIESQCAWGESWISVWPDPKRLRGDEWQRGKDEQAKAYSERYTRQMAEGNVPVRMEVHDPQTVLPFRSNGKLVLVIFESEHSMLDINLGLGYHPLEKAGGGMEWVSSTLSEPYVAQDFRGGVRVSGPDRDHGLNGGGQSSGKKVKSHIYVDAWSYRRFLDGVLVEEWEHGYGCVPVFPAWGIVSSDRDPEMHSVGIIDTALVVAKQIVYFSAMLASNAAQKGWPTPFLQNPDHGLIHPVTGKPLTREIVFGEMNLLGPNEKIEFPFLQANMMPDFYRHMESLTRAFEGSSLGTFSNVNSDTSGYAVAQVRALQDALLGPIYRSAQRQWRKIAYFFRHMVRKQFPSGIGLRGAVDTVEVDGQKVKYRPILEWAKEHCTEYAIDAHIQDGIIQDEIAENKRGLENLQAGVWSPRRVMERTGVQDPVQEIEEIASWRLMNSPAADQLVIQMASALAAQRIQVTRQDMSSPFMQALTQASQQLQQALAPGMGAQQGGQPGNALPGGQPMQQNPAMPAPQQGGPTAGPTPGTGMSFQDLGVPGLPGGVKGGQPMAPAGV